MSVAIEAISQQKMSAAGYKLDILSQLCKQKECQVTPPKKKQKIAKEAPRKKGTQTLQLRAKDQMLFCIYEDPVYIPIWPQYTLANRPNHFFKVGAYETWFKDFGTHFRMKWRKGYEPTELDGMQVTKVARRVSATRFWSCSDKTSSKPDENTRKYLEHHFQRN